MADPKPTAKGSLRAAREAMARGEPREALKWTRSVLKHDKLSYEAYVLAGKAAFQLDERDFSEAAYRKATDVNPLGLPAWQGLAELHSVTDSGEGNSEQLVAACEHIVDICQRQGDSKRAVDYQRRLAAAYAACGRVSEAASEYEKVAESPVTSPEALLEALSELATFQVAEYDRLVTDEVRALKAIEKSKAKARAISEDEEAVGMGREPAREKETLREVATGIIATGAGGKQLEAALRRVLLESDKGPSLSLIGHAERLMLLLMCRVRVSAAAPAGGTGHSSPYQVALTSALQLMQELLSRSLMSATATFASSLSALDDDTAEDELKTWHLPSQLRHMSASEAATAYVGARVGHLYPECGWQHLAVALRLHRRVPAELRPSVKERRAVCEKALRLQEDSPLGWMILAEVRLEEGSAQSAAECARRGLQAAQRLSSALGLRLLGRSLHLKLLRARAQLAAGLMHDAGSTFLEAAQDLQREKAPMELLLVALQGLAEVSLAQGDAEGARQRLAELLSRNPSSHWALGARGQLALSQGDAFSALEDLQAAAALQPKEWSYHLLLGRAYWELGGESRSNRGPGGAHAEFLEAAKLQPDSAEAFRYLGHFYRQVAGDHRRAQQCYQRAVSLDPTDSSAGEALCELLTVSEQLALRAAVCHDASQRAPLAHWAWSTQGLAAAEAGQWDISMRSLQQALRSNPSSGICWEALGLVYQRLGRHTAALKAYGQALLHLEGLARGFSLLQTGNVHLVLSAFSEAEASFREAVLLLPGHVAGRWGLAAAIYGKAQSSQAQGAFAWASDLLQEAEPLARACAADNPTSTSAWKLLGDILLLQAQTLLCRPEGSLDQWQRMRSQAAAQAVRAHLHTTHLQPSSSAARGDVATSLALQEALLKADVFSTATTSMGPARGLAEEVALGAVRLQGGSAPLWALLGTVAKSPARRQHALVCALKLDPVSAPAWASLATLYLQQGEINLAQQALEHARSAEPLHPLPWAAKARLLAVSANPPASWEDLEEAFASSLYAVQRFPVAELQLGLGVIAAQTGQLGNPQVYAGLAQAVLVAPHRPSLKVLLGLAQEAAGLLPEAVTSFRVALEATANENPSQISLAGLKLCLARTLSNMGGMAPAKEAVTLFEQVAENGGLGTDWEAWGAFARALGQAGENERALAAALQAAQVAPPLTSQSAACLRLVLVLRHRSEGSRGALEVFQTAPPESCSQPSFQLAALACAAGLRSSMALRVAMGHGFGLQSETTEQAYEAMALVSRLEGKPAEATQALLRGLHACPNSGILRAAAARAFVEAGQPQLGARLVKLRQVAFQGHAATASLSECMLACPFCTTRVPHWPLPKAHSRACFGAVQRWQHEDPSSPTARLLLLQLTMQQAQLQGHPAGLYRAALRLSLALLALLPPRPMTVAALLCASECCLRLRGTHASIEQALAHAQEAANAFPTPGPLHGFVQLQLARCHVALADWPNANREAAEISPEEILPTLAWAQVVAQFPGPVLKMAQRQLDLTAEVNAMWRPAAAAFGATFKAQAGGLAAAQAMIGEALAGVEGASAGQTTAVLDLIHGALGVQQMRGGSGDAVLPARRSLIRAVEGGALPGARLLLAEAEKAAAGGRAAGQAKWELHTREEWALWPMDRRPAALYSEMAKLASASAGLEGQLSTKGWMQRAVHLNPACTLYWQRLAAC